MQGVVVKKSRINGLGIFASRDFKKDEIVIKWDISHQLTAENVKRLSQRNKKYVAYYKKRYILNQKPAKYVNHSCNANTYIKNFCDVAKRNIKKGEEITGNYSEDKHSGFEMKCTCGNKNCQKIIYL